MNPAGILLKTEGLEKLKWCMFVDAKIFEAIDTKYCALYALLKSYSFKFVEYEFYDQQVITLYTFWY